MKEYTVRVYANGYKYWYLNGKFHREDGPAVECASGTKEWFLNGKRHREDGPVVECADGYKAWYLNDKLHREDGPAIICASGHKAWFLNGKEVTESDVMGHTITIDGKEFKISNESYNNLKKVFKDN